MKKLLLLIFLWVPNISHAAIAFGAVGAGAAQSGVTSATMTGPTVSGSNTFGVLQMLINSTSVTVSATWGGNAMTATPNSPLTVGTNRLYMFYIVNPASAASVVTTFSGSVNYWAYTDYYTGVYQTDPIDIDGTLATAGTSISKTVTSVADNTWGIGVGAPESNGAGTSGSGGTVKRTAAGDGMGIFDTNSAITPAGSVTLSYTVGSSLNLGIIVAAVRPDTYTPPVVPTATSILGLVRSFWLW